MLPSKMAEDGEILSGPDVADGVEITLHADTGISSDEDLLGGNSPPKGLDNLYTVGCSSVGYLSQIFPLIAKKENTSFKQRFHSSFLPENG